MLGKRLDCSIGFENRNHHVAMNIINVFNDIHTHMIDDFLFSNPVGGGGGGVGRVYKEHFSAYLTSVSCALIAQQWSAIHALQYYSALRQLHIWTGAIL